MNAEKAQEEGKTCELQNSFAAPCYHTNSFPRCEVLPKTKRLKQVIKEFGRDWLAIEPVTKMQCFDGGLGVKVKSLRGGHIRNVRYPTQILFY